MAGLSPTVDINNSPLAAAQVATTYGPKTQQALRQSQYLADALRSLQAGNQDIKGGWGELGAKLLATAILQRKNNQGQDALIQAMTVDRNDESSRLLAGLNPSSAAPAAPDGAPPIQLPAAQVQPAPPPSPQPEPPAPTPAAAQYSPQDREALIRMGAVEAGGEGPQGIAAAMHVALNRLRSGYGGAKSLFDVIHQPHQFTGIQQNAQADPHALAMAGQVADQVLGGQMPDPTGGAQAFLNPELTQKLYGRIPAWAQNGRGHRIGNHVFFGGSAQQPGPPPPPDPLGPDVQNVVASGAGADPFPPSAPGAPSPQAVGTVPAGGTPQAPPAGATGGWPTWKPSPKELEYVQSLLNSPRDHAAGVALAQHYRQKMTKPEEAQITLINGVPFYIPKDPTSAAHTQPIPVPNAAMTRSIPGASPSDEAQVSPLGVISHQAIPGVQGGVPEGMVLDPKTHSYVHIPTQQQQTFRMPGVNGVFVTGPDGKPQKVGEDQYGPSELLKMRQDLLGAQPVQLYQQAQDAYGSMVNAAKQNPGGMRAYALRDTFARAINPGAVARVGTIQAIKESQGLPAEIKGFFMNLQGDGNVPPEIAQQILDVTKGFVDSHYHGAKQLVDSNADYARRHGINPSDVTVPIGDAPVRYAIPHPNAAAPPPPRPPTTSAAIQYGWDGKPLKPGAPR